MKFSSFLSSIVNKITKSTTIYLSFLVSFLAISIMLICSFFTFAWFANSRDSSVAGLDVHVEDVKALYIKDYYVYRYSDDSKAGVLDTSDHIHLSSYDTVFTDRNNNTPIIIKFVMEGATISNGDNFTISIDCSSALLENNKIVSSLSNIVQFKCGIISALDNVSNANTIYTTSKTFFGDTNNTFSSATFVSGTTKNNTISLSVSGYTSGTNLTIYLQLNYDSTLVNSYLESNQGSSSVNIDLLGQIINFNSDITELTFTSS